MFSVIVRYKPSASSAKKKGMLAQEKGMFMHNKLRITLFGALILSACMLFFSVTALPASAATSSSTTASHSTTATKSSDVQTVTVPRSRPDYDRGYRDGRFAADRECGRFRSPFRGHGHRESDYSRGYVDGFNFAVGHDRFCQHRGR